MRIIKRTLGRLFSLDYYFRIISNDLKAWFGHKAGGTRVIFVAGYPKSGTTWVENFISHLPGYSPRSLYGDQEVLRQHGLPRNAFSRVPKYAFSSIKTHISPSEDNVDVLVKNGISKVLVMFRDPRDIVVSHYYHVLKVNPWRVSDPWYADYTVLNKTDALAHSMDMIVDDYCSWVSGWKDVARCNPDINCMFLSYEELRSDPVLSFKNILSFFGVELNDGEFAAMMLATSKRSGRFSTFGQPGKRSTKRKGTSGEWAQELNAEQKKVFKEKAGRFLIDLGYETDLEW